MQPQAACFGSKPTHGNRERQTELSDTDLEKLADLESCINEVMASVGQGFVALQLAQVLQIIRDFNGCGDTCTIGGGLEIVVRSLQREHREMSEKIAAAKDAFTSYFCALQRTRV